MYRIFFLCFFIINSIGLYNCFNIEPLKLELLDSKFRLSIANDPDIKWVAFNVNINKEFRSFESGQLSGVAGMPENQLWSFEFNRKLLDSDIIYVWLAIQHNRLVFRDMKDPISVAAFKSGNPNYYIPTSSTTTTTESPIEIVPTRLPIGPGNENKICYPTKTVTQSGGSFCRDDLIFNEKFDTFDQKIWTNEVRLPSSNDFEFVIYNGTVGVEKGMLQIDASLHEKNIRKDTIDLGSRCTSFAVNSECVLHPTNNLYVPPITSGRINTRNSFNFKYGRVEIRAKLPKGDWLFPLISLEPTYKIYGDMYKSGEMRIAFARGNKDLEWENQNIGGDRLYGGAIFSTNALTRNLFMPQVALSKISKTDAHFGDNFHIYSLTWKPEEIILAVDNYEYGRIETNFKSKVHEPAWDKGEDNAPLDQFFYITLGLSAGGHGDFPDGKKPWKNTAPSAILKFNDERGTWSKNWGQPKLEVDFVRVYAI